MTASLKEVLRNTLEQLAVGEFKRFRRNLHDQDQDRMPLKKLERADRDNTVDMMVQVYSTKDVGDKMLSILEKMNFNQFAMELRRALESLPGNGGVKVDITAHSLSEGMPQQGGEAREQARVQKAKAKEQPSQCMRQQNPKAGPSVSNLIVNAVSGSKGKKGVSLFVLMKILADGGYDVEKNNTRVKWAVKSLVSKGTLVQTKGTGASGSFKLNKQAEAKKKPVKKAAPKAKKPAVKKSPRKAKKPAAPKKAAKRPKKSKAGGVKVNATAHSEGMVNAPTVAGCNIYGPVIINVGRSPPPQQEGEAKAPRPKKARPSVSDLVVKAVSPSKEKKAVSLSALKKALAAGGYDVEKNNTRVKLAVKSLVSKGTLVQTKGTGASGSFKLNKQAEAKKKPVKKAAPKAKKPAGKRVSEDPKKPAAAKKAAKRPKKSKAAKPKDAKPKKAAPKKK